MSIFKKNLANFSNFSQNKIVLDQKIFYKNLAMFWLSLAKNFSNFENLTQKTCQIFQFFSKLKNFDPKTCQISNKNVAIFQKSVPKNFPNFLIFFKYKKLGAEKNYISYRFF